MPLGTSVNAVPVETNPRETPKPQQSLQHGLSHASSGEQYALRNAPVLLQFQLAEEDPTLFKA